MAQSDRIFDYEAEEDWLDREREEAEDHAISMLGLEERDSMPFNRDLNEQQGNLTKQHNYTWKPIERIDRNSIVMMPLKHPYHDKVYNRFYLVVGCDRDTASRESSLAVIGLETNGGLGRAIYRESAQPFLMEIKISSDGAGEAKDSLYVDPYPNNWRPKDRTIVDFTTILIFRPHKENSNGKIPVKEMAILTRSSAEKVVKFYNQLGREDDYRDLLTGRTPKIAPGYSSMQQPDKGQPLPERISNTTVTIFDSSSKNCGHINLPGAVRKSTAFRREGGNSGVLDDAQWNIRLQVARLARQRRVQKRVLEGSLNVDMTLAD